MLQVRVGIRIGGVATIAASLASRFSSWQVRMRMKYLTVSSHTAQQTSQEPTDLRPSLMRPLTPVTTTSPSQSSRHPSLRFASSPSQPAAPPTIVEWTQCVRHMGIIDPSHDHESFDSARLGQIQHLTYAMSKNRHRKALCEECLDPWAKSSVALRVSVVHWYACSVSDFESHRKGKEIEWYTYPLVDSELSRPRGLLIPTKQAEIRKPSFSLLVSFPPHPLVSQ